MIDHHCDLLYALARDESEPIRCRPDQMVAGGIGHQVLAIFTPTGENSVRLGMKQLEIYRDMPRRYPGLLSLLGDEATSSAPLTVSLSIENASSFCDEDEPLYEGLARFELMRSTAKYIRYLSLTWSGENRFGGGNGTHVGLKADGKELLRYMSGKSIPIDFSHTSDMLADDIINTVDRENLRISFLASHSNFRSVTDHERNLPDDIAREIIRRGGIIGLNLVTHFVGERSDYLRQVEYGVEKLGAQDALAFGCDYFETEQGDPWKNFFPEWSDATSGSKLLEHVSQYSPIIAAQMASENSQRFYGKVVGWKDM